MRYFSKSKKKYKMVTETGTLFTSEDFDPEDYQSSAT